MLNQKQKQNENFNDTQLENLTAKISCKNFPPDKRHPGHRSRYGKYGPRSGYGFLPTACQPIRMENFEKPYNNNYYYKYYINYINIILYKYYIIFLETELKHS